MPSKINSQNEDNMHVLGVLLNTLMEECDIDDIGLSKQTGVPASTISRMRINPNANPTAATLRPIAKFFDISISQLLGDEPLPSDRITGTHNPTPFTAAKIPVITWKSAEQWQDGNYVVDNLAINWITTERSVSKNTFAVVVPTDSFGPAFRKGSLLICDPETELKDGDLVLVKFKVENEILFRQLIKDGSDTYIRSVNPELKSIRPLVGDYKLLGIVDEIRYLPSTRLESQTTTSQAAISTFAGINDKSVNRPILEH